MPHYGYKPSGGFRIIYQIANRLSERNYQVTLIHTATVHSGPRSIMGWYRTLRDKKRATKWFAFEKNVNIKYVLTLQEKNIPDADFTVATSCETSYFLNKYHETKGKKVYYIQGYELWAGGEERVLRSWKFDMIKIMISQDLCEKARQKNIPNVYYIPNAIDTQLFKLCDNIEERQDVIAMMCSKDKNKGTENGIEVLKKVLEKKPEVKIKCFGTCSRPESLPYEVEYYENPRQEFLIEEIYNKAKIFIFNSIYEGWGLPPMEAMACGAAVVTTDCGGVRDFATDNESAYICKPGDIDQMYCKVWELLTDERKRVDMAINAYQNIQNFKWDLLIDKFENVLKSLNR